MNQNNAIILDIAIGNTMFLLNISYDDIRWSSMYMSSFSTMVYISKYRDITL